jgi:hypothetical protein
VFHLKPLSQTDPRWKERKLGFSNDLTIGLCGCLLTSITMVTNGFGYDETPESLMDKLKDIQGFKGSGIVPPLVNKIAPGIKYKKRIQCSDPPAPLAEIDAHLASGLPVVVKVDYYKDQPGVQDHWIVIYDKQGDDYLIQDPWPNPPETKEVTLTGRYGFAGSPAQIIKDAIFFEGLPKGKPATPGAPAPAPAKPPGNALTVYAVEKALALRKSPTQAPDNLIMRMPRGSQMTVIGPGEAAKKKVGQPETWLKVRLEPGGQQGYVAAWYLSLTDPNATPPAGGQPPSPPPAAAPLVIYANVEGLPLQRAPISSTGTLIRRLPIHTELAVLEPAAQAKPKIGAQNQWLKVRDVIGTEGYVAAQYTAASREDPPVNVRVQGDGHPPPPPAPPPDGSKLVVRSTEAGLALRSQPVISQATLVKRLPLGSELVVLDPTAEAEKKIGVVDEWIKVRDIAGTEGYIAAWYVVKQPRPTS